MIFYTTLLKQKMWILLLVILILMHAANPDCHKFYQNMVEFPTHIPGSTLDHVYVKKSFLEGYEVETVVLNTYFSDHDAVRVKISKNNIDFMIT